jgi:sec-independent protein translocase protein TatB
VTISQLSCRALDRHLSALLPIRLGSMMSCMGFSETLVLVVLAYLLFGPKKLPEIARTVGKALNEFKRASNEFKAQIASEISQLEMETQHQQILPPAEPPAGSVTASSQLIVQAAPDSAVKAAPDA